MSANNEGSKTAYFHLPGLYEFTDFYKVFLELYSGHKDYFYEWCEIGSIYGAPSDCIWGGGRVGYGDAETSEVINLMNKYGISSRLTFSNSLIGREHLANRRCNILLEEFEAAGDTENGIVIYSDLLLEYIRSNYPGYYFVSSTTKVITDFDEFAAELDRDEFKYVVPDFRLNKELDRLNELTPEQKAKTEFLVNECCFFGCRDRKACYENVSRKSLGVNCPDHVCHAPGGSEGYKFSKAMENPAFIGVNDISETYLPMGFCNFKIEGRGLGSAVLLEFILYYMTKPKYQLKVREAIYLDCMLDLF